VWAFLLSLVGVGVTVFGTQTSSFLFDWDSGDALVHRDRIVAGGALLSVSALIWWRLVRRTPAIVSGAIAVLSLSVAFAAPGSLFFLALASPVVVIVGVGAAIEGLASGTARRGFARLLCVGAAGAVLATAALLGLGPALGLVGVMGVTLAAGAVAALVAPRGDGEFRR
jgi:hypothetical protein